MFEGFFIGVLKSFLACFMGVYGLFKFVPLCFGNDNLQTLQYEINVGIKDRVPGIRLRYDRDL